MSAEQIIELDERRAFEATLRFESLEEYHVPFDKLTGTVSTETALSQLAARARRAAVVGPIGCGKSSVMSYVLGPFADRLPDAVVPLRIPVAGEANETVTTPLAFARHLISTVIRWADPEGLTPAERENFERAAAELRSRPGSQKLRKFNLKAPGWLADVGFSSEVKTTGEDIQQRLSTGDLVQETRRLIQLFRAHGREPFFVIDDSDAWLRLAPGDDRTDLAEAFFRQNVALMARELDCGFVVAVHTDYQALPGYRYAERLLPPPIAVPRLSDPLLALVAILERRIEVSGLSASVDEVIEREALLALESHYDAGQSLRDVLRAADSALSHARSEAAPTIGRALMRRAIAEQRRP